MKYIIVLSLLLFSASLYSQDPVWSDVSTVNDIDSLGILRPQIALTNNEVPVVMWGKANQNIYVSRWNGSGFGSATQVNPPGVFAYIQSWVSPIMASSGDNVYVAFKSQPDKSGLIYIVKSTNGGVTFGDTVRVSNDNWSRFPTISVHNNKVVVSYMQFNSNWIDPRYVVCVSTDGGTTFSNPVDATALAPGEACDCCPSSTIATSDQEILLYRNNDSDLRDFWVAVSSNNGATFPLAADLDNNNWMINSCPSTGPDGIIVDDHLIAVWMSGASSFGRVNIVKANMSDLSVDFVSEVDTGSMKFQNYPKIEGGGGNIGIVWQELDDGMDIKFSWTNIGVEQLVNGPRDTVNINMTGSQTNPQIAYAKGIFHIVWQDDENLTIEYRNVDVGDPLAVENIASVTPQWTIYPNPGTERIFINSTTDLNGSDYTLFDTHTRVIKAGSLQDGSISVNSLSPGVYYLRFNNEMRRVVVF